MQLKKQTFLDFQRRTNTLTVKLGVRLGDLPEKIGISRASFFAYRAGKSPISTKAWHKLEFAERECGIVPPLHEQFESAAEDQKRELLASASLEEVLNLLPADERKRIATAVLDAQIDSLRGTLVDFFFHAEALADLVKKKGPKSDLKYFSQKVGETVKSSRETLEILTSNFRKALGLDPRSFTERMTNLKETDESKPRRASSTSDKQNH